MNEILIIGAGIAGCTAAATFAAAGYRVHVFEAAASPAHGASGNLAGALLPRFSAHDARIQTFYGQAFRWTTRWLTDLQANSKVQFWNPCGLVLSPKNDRERERHRQWLQHPFYQDMLQPHDDDAIFLPASGWVRAPLLCAHLLHHKNITTHYNTVVQALEPLQQEEWQVTDGHGHVRQGRVVLATAWNAPLLYPPLQGQLKPVRGQMNLLPENDVTRQLKNIHCRTGYILPAIEGQHVMGASYERGDTACDLRPASTLANIERATQSWPSLKQTAVPHPETLPGRASVRAETPDHFPIAGELAPGLLATLGHGSRGLLTAPYVAQLLLDC